MKKLKIKDDYLKKVKSGEIEKETKERFEKAEIELLKRIVDRVYTWEDCEKWLKEDC